MAVDIYIHTYQQDPEPVIAACRQHLPELRVLLLVDGDNCAYRHTPCIHFPRRLKPQPNGGAWVKRWFETALEYCSDIAIKLDPDSKVHRPFRTPFPSGQLFGALMNSPTVGKFIHGGSMGLRRDFMERSLPFLDDPLYKERWFTQMNGTASSDHIIAHLAERLGVELTPWSEVTYFPFPWPNKRFAISHGRWHKDLPPNTPGVRK